MAGFIFFKNFFDKSLLLSSDYLLPTLPFQYIHSLYCGKIKVGFFNSVAITGVYLDTP